jgi:hypothetical protein
MQARASAGGQLVYAPKLNSAQQECQQYRSTQMQAAAAQPMLTESFTIDNVFTSHVWLVALLCGCCCCCSNG